MTKSLHVEITGRVQGVGYRAWTEEEARRLGLSGWVRNCRSGAVEAVFTGDDAAVDAMLEAAAKGPPCSSVKDVVVVGEVEAYEGDFEVWPTE
ncbi:acylphosphatase [Jiella sonneratiae]|uniref:acylphosphatase n=1 Tax=Jiella sonneratiae TaxID=2816856 RepID=A0ABS3J1R3_9HYPH|nr:acylphosphatase [Jiella sonneratiae]MBO0902501.1 acylphosphatase [Jiella sonneratiae]